MTQYTFRNQVEVWHMADGENAVGAVEKRPAKLKHMFASIIPQTGSIGKREGTEFAKMTHKIIVRYNAGKNLCNTQYIMYKGRRFNILYSLNPYEQNEVIELFVQEVIE